MYRASDGFKSRFYTMLSEITCPPSTAALGTPSNTEACQPLILSAVIGSIRTLGYPTVTPWNMNTSSATLTDYRPIKADLASLWSVKCTVTECIKASLPLQMWKGTFYIVSRVCAFSCQWVTFCVRIAKCLSGPSSMIILIYICKQKEFIRIFIHDLPHYVIRVSGFHCNIMQLWCATKLANPVLNTRQVTAFNHLLSTSWACTQYHIFRLKTIYNNCVFL